MLPLKACAHVGAVVTACGQCRGWAWVSAVVGPTRLDGLARSGRHNLTRDWRASSLSARQVRFLNRWIVTAVLQVLQGSIASPKPSKTKAH